MSRLSFLSFQYGLSKRRRPKPVKWPSLQDRQFSGLMPTFHPDKAEMKRVFDKIDSDGDGKISSDDFRKILETMGTEDLNTEMMEMMRVADLDRDGFISFRDFMGIHKEGVIASDIQRAFWAFDANGDGRIGADEVMAVMNKIGERCSLEECRRMVRQVDKSGNELVDMDDFMNMMTSTMKHV